MEVKLFQDTVYRIGLSVILVLVDTMEYVVCDRRGQCRDVKTLAGGRDGGDTRCNAETDVAELTQLFYHSVNFSGIRPSRVENGLGVIEAYDHLSWGQGEPQGS